MTDLLKIRPLAEKTITGISLYRDCVESIAKLSPTPWGLPYGYANHLAEHGVRVRRLLRHLGLPDSAYFAPEYCRA